jgi:hypothetical protein
VNIVDRRFYYIELVRLSHESFSFGVYVFMPVIVKRDRNVQQEKARGLRREFDRTRSMRSKAGC